MGRKLNSFVVYGHAGTGKTTMVARALPRAIWAVTRKTNLDGHHDWIEKNAATATAESIQLVPDKHILQIPFKQWNAERGVIEDVSTKDYIDRVVRSYISNTLSGKLAEVEGFVIDEFSVLMNRVYQELSLRERNGFEVIKQFKRWVSELCEIPMITGKPMALICHAQDPRFDEDGMKLRYKGGPAMPIGTMVAEICALPDAVLQLEMRTDPLNPSAGTKRVLKTEAHPEWERKIRLWGVAPEIEPDLRSLLKQAGW